MGAGPGLDRSRLMAELRQAEHFCRQAVELVPGNEGVKRNLARVLAAQGKGERRHEPPDVGEAARKGDATKADEDSFYWVE